MINFEDISKAEIKKGSYYLVGCDPDVLEDVVNGFRALEKKTGARFVFCDRERLTFQLIGVDKSKVLEMFDPQDISYRSEDGDK